MNGPFLTLAFPTADAMQDLATGVAGLLRRGDTLLLSGDIGAGKSTFARAAIQARLGRAEHVPSPTFTIVQVYDHPAGDLWHCDLYRLTDTDEAFELGLDEAFEGAICLIEWPDRLGDAAPQTALQMDFVAGEDAHCLTLTGSDAWQTRFADTTPSNDHLAGTRWSGWQASAIAGDASGRQYTRLTGPDGATAIQMVTPLTEFASQMAFCRIAETLHTAGLAVPQILHADGNRLVITDLGPTDMASALDRTPDAAPHLYSVATDILLHLHDLPPPTDLKRLTPELAGDMVRLAATHYADRSDIADPLAALMTQTMAKEAPTPDRLALRDFHAENLIWRPQSEGLSQLGLLDFQDAFVAPAGYDLVSLLRDARRDVADDIYDAALHRFCDKADIPIASFRAQMACLGVQRNLRILGVFARLARDQGKTRYIPMLDRVWSHLMRDLSHPAMTDMAKLVATHLPDPTTAVRGWKLS